MHSARTFQVGLTVMVQVATTMWLPRFVQWMEIIPVLGIRLGVLSKISAMGVSMHSQRAVVVVTVVSQVVG